MLENSNSIGICIKNKSSIVTYQNITCKNHCGDQINNVCQKGCMLAYSAESPESIKQGVHYRGIIDSDVGPIESIVIEDNQCITTIFYDLKNKKVAIQEDLDNLKDISLTNSELTILNEILAGKTKTEIAKALFVSLSTIKNHINNLYKKLPQNWDKLKDRKLFKKFS